MKSAKDPVMLMFRSSLVQLQSEVDEPQDRMSVLSLTRFQQKVCACVCVCVCPCSHVSFLPLKTFDPPLPSSVVPVNGKLHKTFSLQVSVLAEAVEVLVAGAVAAGGAGAASETAAGEAAAAEASEETAGEEEEGAAVRRLPVLCIGRVSCAGAANRVCPNG